MKLKHLIFVMAGVFMLTLINPLRAEFVKGKEYHGFKLVEKKYVPEVNAECLYFRHEKSGARLLKIVNDDPNKTFSVAFKTLPECDCGTPHIMEHSVLNGSEHFPVKSPFDVLSKGSLNTFLNAMTGSDLTIYPVASMNDKDFHNLMHVYLDAVFFPLIYKDPRILKQEGWHYELTEKDGMPVYKGVVYNEMKGAFSSPTRELNYRIYQTLFPDNNYKYSSGGYPAAIPHLTYEQFINFHKRYYHPANSYIFVYGNGDTDKELSFIDKEYLSKFDKIDVNTEIPLQKPFDQMKKYTGYYPVTENAPTENQTYLALSFVAGRNTDRALVMSLELLVDLLVNQESAPIRLALQEAGIGKDVYAYVDDIQQNVFQIVVTNANPDDKEKFLQIVMNTLQKTTEEKLDKEAVEGTLNRMEFNLREGDDAQKGLSYNFRALTGWLFADDPFLTLGYEKPLAEVKKSLKSDYLENIISKYLINNKHVLLTSLLPKPGLEKENNEKITEELKQFAASLSETDKENLVNETRELIAYQKEEDTPEALATIPMLDLSDIKPEVEWYKWEEKNIGKTKVLFHEDFTNNVVYLNLYFDLRAIPSELIPYASLLSDILGSMNTDKYSYGELDKELNIHTGGFSTYLTSYLEETDDDKLVPEFVVSTKAMNDKTAKMLELTSEIINNTKLNDNERLKEVLIRLHARLEANIKRNGFGYTRTRLLSYFTNRGKFDELSGGVAYYNFISDLVKSFDDKAPEISQNLIKISDMLFNRNNLIAGFTGSAKDFRKFGKKYKKFVKSLNNSPVTMQNWVLNPQPQNEAMLAASKVQYVIEGYSFKKLGYEWSGKMRVLTQILSRDWLQTRIRVIGGAYGGFSSFYPDGSVYFASYRDPNLKETLENYAATPEYLHDFKADKQTMTRFIIGTIARMDHPLTPSQKGKRAFQRYFEKTTLEQLQKTRQEVLATTDEDIRNFEKLVKEILDKKIYCVYGNENKIKQNKKLFNKIIELNK